jgi:hypothetical protein
MTCDTYAVVLKSRHRLSRVASAVMVCLILFGTAIKVGAADPPFSVSPTTAMPGETITYTGTGWRDPGVCGNTRVELTINPGDISLGSMSVGPTGNWSGTFPAPTAPGAYTLTAMTRLPGTPQCTEVAAFDVVAPTTTTTAPTTTTSTVPGASTEVPAEPEAAGEPETGPGEPQAAPAPVSSTPLPVTG